MRLYLLNTVDEDQVQADLDDKRAVEYVVDACLRPSSVFTSLEAAQAAGQKIYEEYVEEINEGEGEDDRIGAYELDWVMNEPGTLCESSIEVKQTLNKLHFRITILEV